MQKSAGAQWGWNKESFPKRMKRIGWMFSILAASILMIDFGSTPKLFGDAKIEDFAIVKDRIADAKIIEGTHVSRYGQVNKFYTLYIKTSSDQTFHLRRPDQRGQLASYLAVLPIGKEVSIRYFDALFDGQRIIDVRDDNQIFIPFSEIIADENQKRNGGRICIGIFSFIGVIGFWFGREKQKQHGVSEHIQTHQQ
jgi:hypothetical protein